MKLLSRSRRPPTGWVYLQADTQTSFTAPTLDQLASQIQKHRIGNKLPRTGAEHIREDVEAYICGLMRGTRALFYFCQTPFPIPPPPGSRVTIDSANPTVIATSATPPAPRVMIQAGTAKTASAPSKPHKKRRCRGCGGP